MSTQCFLFLGERKKGGGTSVGIAPRMRTLLGRHAEDDAGRVCFICIIIAYTECDSASYVIERRLAAFPRALPSVLRVPRSGYCGAVFCTEASRSLPASYVYCV